MVQAPRKLLTLEDFLQLPETKPASEYLNGQIIQKPLPQGEHSAIQTELAPAINAIVKPQKIARAFTELRCSFGDRSLVPDISVFRWERIPRKPEGGIANRFLLAPDWAIEILSPDQSQTKVTKNILHCLNHGTPMGWLIDPGERSVLIFSGDRPTIIYDQPQSQLSVPEFAQQLQLKIQELFGWLEE
ncbi:MAG: Uma2 family endonuclease [Cyanobacteria bacterium P01_G01_bin.54]